MMIKKNGGADGNQTHDLIIANDALYQLSYSPQFFKKHLAKKYLYRNSARLDASLTMAFSKISMLVA